MMWPLTQPCLGVCSFLRILSLFLPLSRRLFSQVWPGRETGKSLFGQLFPLRTRPHVTSLEMLFSHSLYPHPALFSFTALTTTCHIFICYMFVFSSLECNVHESRVFSLLTAGTMCPQQCLTQSRHFILIEWMNRRLVPKMPPVWERSRSSHQ